MIEPFNVVRSRTEPEMGLGVQLILALVMICLFGGATWLMLAN